jgi:glycosyltransferase involved in cell wall biosynthesis
VSGERTIAISHFIAEHIVANYRADPAKIRLVPRGVDLRLFDPQAVSQERIIQLATRWRLPDGAPVVMLPGRLTPWKGHAVLIDAIAKLARKDVICLFVGDEQNREGYREALLRQIDGLGLAGRVRLLGPTADMSAAYMLADVVVSASIRPEAFGRVIMEAQAMERLVVATEHGGARETVLRGQTGWLVPPGQAEPLAAAIDEALAMAAAARAMRGAAARRHIAAEYALETMCERTLTVYREVLAEHAATAEAYAGS